MTRTLLALMTTGLMAAAALADVTFPARIGDRAFILDEAELIADSDEAIIVEQCDVLLTERRIPIIIVTIDSLSDYGAGSLTIERYAADLFDEWEIGFEDYNYGVLLLVAKNDRKARIELGADWGREHDEAAQKVMDRLIIPQFKKGEFSTGVTLGVDGLDKMARGEDIPGSPLGDMARKSEGIVKEIFSSLGKAMLFWLALPLVLIMAAGRRIFGWGNSWGDGGGWGGGGFGGGSFGGGFSGGGGATGSW